jgi:HPt (histidine-containing phosphotransfer) domain-containing protein
MSQESLNSITNALQEYNEYLDRLVSRLGNITSELNKLDGAQEWFGKIKKAEEWLFAIEVEFSEFIDYFSSSQKACLCSYLPSLTVRCTRWEDFRTQSTNAELVSFLREERERVFQVCALKDGKVLRYSGEFPQHAKLLKSWLSRELGTPRETIVEGVLAIG